jgi:protein-arginine kinase activator protein McsA
MFCEKCKSKATVHVTERGSSGSFEEHHYCQACSGVAQRDLPVPFPVPSEEQLVTALIEAGALTGRHLTREEAFEAVMAFVKSLEPEPPDASTD